MIPIALHKHVCYRMIYSLVSYVPKYMLIHFILTAKNTYIRTVFNEIKYA